MNKLLQKFKLAFSIAPKEIISIIRSYSKKQHARSLPAVSKTLWKKIEKYKKDLEENGLPPFLEIAEVNRFIQTGVFLKPTAKALKPDTFIGLYTGEFELVFANETADNHYAYDVAPGLKIKKEHLPLVRSKGKKATVKIDYSIQTNAMKEGNFTRYINHSSVNNNIEALTKKMPDGTIEVCLFTCKTIKPGEQLLSNYGGLYWAVLPILPEPVTPRSYMLTKESKVVKKETGVEGHSSEQHAFLIKLRSPLELETGELPSAFRSFLSKKKIRYVSKALEQKIEDFDDDILERGLPLKYELKETSSHLKYDVHLKKKAKMIKKGSFIGVFGGKWHLVDHKASNMIDSGLECKGMHLFLDQEKGSNFTRLLTKSSNGNIKATLYKKRGPNGLYIVLTAAKNISPGDKLSLKE